LGSSLSLCGLSRLGSSLSVLDFLHLGASLALRSMARLGSSLSLYDWCNMGSSLSVRSFMRVGSSIAVRDGETLRLGHSYAKYDSGTSELVFHVGGGKALSIGNHGGTLHGSWVSDSTLTSSDRRLKSKIEDLRETLLYARGPRDAASASSSEEQRLLRSKQGHAGASAASAPEMLPGRATSSGALDNKHGSQEAYQQQEGEQQTEDPALWVLRQLRPVSYSLKANNEAKSSGRPRHFGFIADELQMTLPQVVQSTPAGAGAASGERTMYKRVAYQDLIAVLTLVAQRLRVEQEGVALEQQRHQSRVNDLEKTVRQLEEKEKEKASSDSRVNDLEKAVRQLQEKEEKASGGSRLTRLETSVRRLELENGGLRRSLRTMSERTVRSCRDAMDQSRYSLDTKVQSLIETSLHPAVERMVKAVFESRKISRFTYAA